MARPELENHIWWVTAADVLRSLYLKLVKKYHPDLALSQKDKQQRHELMVAINEAWSNEDIETLQAIDTTGRVPPQHPTRPTAPRPPRRYPSSYGSEGKDRDLANWRRYLRKVAKEIAARGYTEAKIFTMAGGPAVAGEVAAYFYAPGKDFGVYIQASSDRGLPSPIMARWTAREERGKSTQTGPNQWFKKIIPEVMAADLARIAEQQNQRAS